MSVHNHFVLHLCFKMTTCRHEIHMSAQNHKQETRMHERDKLRLVRMLVELTDMEQ